MQTPLQITFRGMEPSQFVEARVRELALRLERFDARITTCHVTIHAPPRHHHHGQRYDVRIRLGVPGREIVVGREGSNDPAYEDVYVAIRDTFDAAARKLEDRVRRLDHRSRARRTA